MVETHGRHHRKTRPPHSAPRRDASHADAAQGLRFHGWGFHVNSTKPNSYHPCDPALLNFLISAMHRVCDHSTTSALPKWSKFFVPMALMPFTRRRCGVRFSIRSKPTRTSPPLLPHKAASSVHPLWKSVSVRLQRNAPLLLPPPWDTVSASIQPGSSNFLIRLLVRPVLRPFHLGSLVARCGWVMRSSVHAL